MENNEPKMGNAVLDEYLNRDDDDEKFPVFVKNKVSISEPSLAL